MEGRGAWVGISVLLGPHQEQGLRDPFTPLSSGVKFTGMMLATLLPVMVLPLVYRCSLSLYMNTWQGGEEVVGRIRRFL